MRPDTLIFSFILIILTLPIARAQNSDDPKTIFGKHNEEKKLRISTFYGEVSPMTYFSQIQDKLGKFGSLEVGLHVNRTFGLGYYTARSPNTIIIQVPLPGEPDYQTWIDSGVRLNNLPPGQDFVYTYFYHRGVSLSYMFKADWPIFPRLVLKAGRGVFEMNAEQKSFFNFFNTAVYKKKVSNINPEIGVGLNLLPWWRMHIDAGYHFIIDNDAEIVNSGTFDGATIRVGFAFGAFNR